MRPIEVTVLPAMAFAAAIVYWLHRYIDQWLPQGAVALADLLLFVTIFVATNTFLKNLRDG
jgi:hypothetical protein